MHLRDMIVEVYEVATREPTFELIFEYFDIDARSKAFGTVLDTNSPFLDSKLKISKSLGAETLSRYMLGKASIT
jgi:hypothetical protein